MHKIIKISAFVVVALCMVGVTMAFDINHQTNVVTEPVQATGLFTTVLPTVTAPTITAPTLAAPTITVPIVSVPSTVSAPTVTAPTVAAPTVTVPTVIPPVVIPPIVTPPHLPTCVLNSSTRTVEEKSSVTISWSSSNASNVTLTNFGSVESSGSRTFTASGVGTQTYTLSVSGQGSSSTCVVVITVIPCPDPLPDCTLTASPVSVVRGGQTVLTWSAINADSAIISGGVGAVSLGNGSRQVTPDGTTTYVLTVKKGQETKSCPVTVTVTEQPAAPTCDAFTASPTVIFRGDSSTLTWSTSNATSVSINQGINTVDADGTRSVSPQANTTYTLTASGNGTQVTCPVSIEVRERSVETPFTCANNVNFTASPLTIDEGESSTLGWSVSGATSVAISNGVNTNNAFTGSVAVSPSANTTYTLTATKNSTTISCPVTISVDEDNGGGGGGGGGGSATPRCELTASDRTISSGDRVTLKWNTSAATAVEIKDNRNQTIVTTDGKLGDDKKDLYDGSITVRPTRDTTYTLTAARGSRDRECTVKIDVDDVKITEIRDQQPLVTSISLTDVPYTGVDARTAIQLTVLAIIVLWGAYLGYAFYRRDKVAVTKS
ncbi:hypothetical protein K2Q16_03270 [Patescibacteria group bacterium]|nr:hypothetical protein [Patescibacteria group bacterium]